MTRIASIADVHVANHRRFGGTLIAGMNQRCRDTTAVLYQAFVAANKQNASALVIDGDLFDSSWPEPQILAKVQDQLRSAREWPGRAKPMEIIILVGNHDQHSTAEGDHALGVLKPYARIVEHPTLVQVDDVELVCIPYRQGRASEWLEGALASIVPRNAKGVKAAAHRLLFVHLGISDDATPPYLRKAADSVDVVELSGLMEKFRIATAFAGNWHEAIVWDDPPPVVQQIGALVPTGWDNPGLDGYGGFAIYDTAAGKHGHIEIPGPRFVHVHSVADADVIARDAVKQGHKLYVKLTVSPAEMAKAVEWVAIEKAAGNIAEAEVVPDQAEARGAARTTAMVTRSAETIESALSEYVAAMTLPAEVERPAVLDTSRQYLARAGGKP